jgi:hypothetical protein
MGPRNLIKHIWSSRADVIKVIERSKGTSGRLPLLTMSGLSNVHRCHLHTGKCEERLRSQFRTILLHKCHLLLRPCNRHQVGFKSHNICSSYLSVRLCQLRDLRKPGRCGGLSGIGNAPHSTCYCWLRLKGHGIPCIVRFSINL